MRTTPNRVPPTSLPTADRQWRRTSGAVSRRAAHSTTNTASIPAVSGNPATMERATAAASRRHPPGERSLPALMARSTPRRHRGRKATGRLVALLNQARAPHRAKATPAAVENVRPTPSRRVRKYVDQPAIASMDSCTKSTPSCRASSNVSGKKTPLCISPANGMPRPSNGFHHGMCPWSQSMAARWPRDWVLNPALGSTKGRPGIHWWMSEVRPASRISGLDDTACTRGRTLAATTAAAMPTRGRR